MPASTWRRSIVRAESASLSSLAALRHLTAWHATGWVANYTGPTRRRTELKLPTWMERCVECCIGVILTSREPSRLIQLMGNTSTSLISFVIDFCQRHIQFTFRTWTVGHCHCKKCKIYTLWLGLVLWNFLIVSCFDPEWPWGHSRSFKVKTGLKENFNSTSIRTAVCVYINVTVANCHGFCA